MGLKNDTPDILSRITYKENVKFYWQPNDGLTNKRLVIEFYVEDSFNPGTKIWVVHTFPCLWGDERMVISFSDKEKFEWVFRCLSQAERHEAREFFKVDEEVFMPPGHGLFENPYL